MEWILYIIGGFIILSILWHSGIIPEFIGMIVMCLMFGCPGGFISWLLDFGWDAGFGIGIIVGLVFYGIYCIARILNPEIRIDFYEDGTKEYHSERGKGIIGLLVLIGSILYAVLK